MTAYVKNPASISSATEVNRAVGITARDMIDASPDILTLLKRAVSTMDALEASDNVEWQARVASLPEQHRQLFALGRFDRARHRYSTYGLDRSGQQIALDEVTAANGFNPQVASATPNVHASSDTVSVPLPTRAIGDRLVIGLNRSSASTDPIATPSGWIPLDSSGATGTAASFCRAYYQDVKIENVAATHAVFAGGTVTLSTSLVWHMTGCDPSIPPVANGTVQNSNTTTVDPATITGPNGGVSQENLFLVYIGTSTQDTALGATPAVTGFPAGYGDTGTTTTTDASTTNGCGQGWCSKRVVAGSDNPGVVTYCPTGTGRAFVIGIAIRAVVG